MHRSFPLVAIPIALISGCAQSVRPVVDGAPAVDASPPNDAVDAGSAAPSEQSIGEGAIIAITLAVDSARQHPAIDQWLDGELAAIARGHSAFGYYVPLRRSGVLGEQLVAPALSARVLARWMNEIAPGRALRSAPTPFAFVQRNGASALWVAHGGIVGITPSVNREPTDQCAVVARTLRPSGGGVWTSAEVDAFVHAHKEQVGASVIALDRGAEQEWRVDSTREGADFDGTDRTRAHLGSHGECFDDRGEAIEAETTAGLVGVSTGIVTPWGTSLLLESNAASSYGESELALTADGALHADALSGFAEGAMVSARTAADGASDFGCVSNARARHRRDQYGYLVEIDATVAPARAFDGRAGQRKLGGLGRGQWRGVVLAPITETPAPLTLYTVDGRAGGTLFKFVTTRAVTRSMSEEALRRSLDETRVYVAHVEGLEAPMRGRWIELSTSSDDRAPLDGRTVAATLSDAHAGGVGAFASDQSIRDALVTAARKVAVTQLDGLRSIAWDPVRGRLVLALHGVRGDRAGSIVTLSERAASEDSSLFHWEEVWHGHDGEDWFAATHPSSIAVDASGTAWFATECEPEFATCRDREGLFVLDLSTSRRAGQPTVLVETYARALRVASAPEGSVFSAPVFDDERSTAFIGVRRAGALQWRRREEP